MNVIGLDLSVAATGVCYADAATVTIKPKSAGDVRFGEIARRVLEFCSMANIHLAVIEQAPPGLKGHADLIYGVQAVVRTELIKAGIPYAEVRPSTLKKFATGSGTATKTVMAMEAYKRAGLEFGDDNQCDAWWLRVAGEVHYEEKNFETVAQFFVPKANRDALSVVAWPDVTRDSVNEMKRARQREAIEQAQRLIFTVPGAA